MTIHHLKINKQPFDDLVSGRKTGEVRDCSDRDFKVGDRVKLFMTETATGLATKSIVRTITHIQHGYGLPDDICVLSYAAPVVERQLNVINLDAVDWEAIQKAADESNWMPNEYMRNEWVSDVCNFLKYGRAEHPAPPELAELQATIARLTAENERVGEFRRRWIRRTLKARDERDQLKTEIERLKGGQGEAVAEVIEHYGFDDGIIRFKTPNMEQLPIGTLLYTSQPAPVSVVLPEPEQVFEAISDALGEALDCTRVWSAWGVGTMSEDDFVQVADQSERLHELASACLNQIKELNQ